MPIYEKTMNTAIEKTEALIDAKERHLMQCCKLSRKMNSNFIGHLSD